MLGDGVMNRLKYLLPLMAIIVLFTGCSENRRNHKSPEDGVIDLTEWDPYADGNISLDGEWEQYLSGEDNDTYNSNCVYRLRVKTSFSIGTRLAIGIYDYPCQYRIFINDFEVFPDVQDSQRKKDALGEYRPTPILFAVPSSEFDIIMYASNTGYSSTGLGLDIHLGNERSITNKYVFRMFEMGALYGMIIIVTIFFMCVSLLGLKIKYPIYFSVFCLLFIIYADSLTYSVFLRLFYIAGMWLVRIIINSSKAWIFFFLTAYFHELFKYTYSEIIFRIIRISTILQQIFIIIICACTTTISPIGLSILNIIHGLELMANVSIVLYAIVRRQKDGLRNLLGMIIIITAYYYHTAIKLIPFYKDIIFLATFFFLVLQMLSMAKYIKKFYEEKRNAELRFLHAQIKPHFIFNALNTIISISRYNVESSRKLLCDFSIYLQKSFDLKNENQFTSLKDELELVNVYLNIEKARFEERIEIEMVLPENQEMNVPVCVLQPIVENAIVHGILNKPEGGNIYINIVDKEDKLTFTVRDTGVGMTKERISGVFETENIGHIGLSNINKRLKVLYKKGLTIKSELGKGTEVFWEVVLNN